MPLPHGLYEALLDESLRDVLQKHPELRSVFGKLDPEEESSRYASFVAKVLEQALRVEAEPGARLRLCNELIACIAGRPADGVLAARRLVEVPKSVLLEVTPRAYAE